MKQKSVIVMGENNLELNQCLRDGWRVHSMCPMPSSCTVSTAVAGEGYSSRDKEAFFRPQCLVILEID